MQVRRTKEAKPHQGRSRRLPASLRSRFWNIDDVGALDVNEDAEYIIGRLLETYPTPEAVDWMRATYGDARIREYIVKWKARGLAFEQVAQWVSRSLYARWVRARPPSIWASR